MKTIDNLVIGKEYFFSFKNYFCTGFIVGIFVCNKKDNFLIIENGAMFSFENKYSYNNALIKLSSIVDFDTINHKQNKKELN